jgi:nicotinamidase-related amidase
MQIELNYPEAVPVTLDASKTILVCVDMENDACHPKAEGYGERMRSCVEKLAALQKRVRAAGGKIIHTQSVRKRDCLEFTHFNGKVRKIEGSWEADFVDELKPLPGEPVIVKYTHDCFYNTEMDALLKKMGARPAHTQIIVTGVATRACVLHAVGGFHIRDYYLYVPMDCTTQKKEEDVLQAFSLFTGFAYSYNTVMTRSDLITLTPVKAKAAATA